MTTIDLRNLPQPDRLAKINEAVAVHCAGYVLYPGPGEPPMSKLETPEPWCYRDHQGRFYLGEPYGVHGLGRAEMGLTFGYMWTRPKFTEDANAVLPLLEKGEMVVGHEPGKNHRVQFWINDAYALGAASSFPLAACLALLRAQGVEVIQ